MKSFDNRFYLPIYPSILQENEKNYLDEIDYLSLKFFLPFKNTLNLKTNKKENKDDNETKKQNNIEKILSLQYYKRKREENLKEIIVKFLEKSEIIKNLTDEIKIEEISNENIEENKIFLMENTKMIKISRILNSLSEIIHFQKFYKFDFILKQNDMNENIYILINGSLSLLKPIELIIDEMSYDEFIKYILYLLKEKEKYLIEKVLKKNPKIFYLEKYEELNKIIKCYIKIKIYNYIKNHLNTITYFKIEKKFEEYLQNFKEYKIVPKELKDVLIERVKDENKWKEYVNKYFKPKTDIYIYFNNYNYLLANKHIKKKVILYKYEIFKILKPGAFFGLDKNEENEFNNNHIEYSIRCEKDSIIAHVSFKHYYNLINEENKKFKTKELNILLKNFFFKGFSLVLFEKYYFNSFKEVIFNKDKIVFNQGDKFKDIYLFRQGKIKLEFYGSIIDIHNNIRYIIEKIWEKNIWNLKEEEIINLKNTYLNEPDILLLKYKDEIFKDEMNKNRKFNLFILNSYDTIGLEYMFLESPYLTNCKIISQKGIFFKVKSNVIEKIIKNENGIKLQYDNLIYKKLISYIERLNSFKKNYIKIVKFKIKKDLINIRNYNNINNSMNKIDKSIYNDFTYKLHNYLKNKKSEIKLKNENINNNSIKKYIESYNNKNTNNNKHNKKNFFSNRTNSNFTNIISYFNFTDRQSTINKNKNSKIKNFKKIFSYQTIDNNNENKNQNSKQNNKHINISQDTIIQNKKGFIRINKKLKNLSRNLKNNSISLNSNINIDKNNNHSNNSYISIINLSSNKEYSDENLLNNKKNVFQNNLIRKNKKFNRAVSQDNIYKNTKMLDENIEKNYKTIEKIKNFYETKKFLGYSSLINLDNNKYCVQRLLYKKNENKIKFRKNFMKGILIQNIKKVKKFVNKNI